MTLRQEVAQMVMPRLDGGTVGDPRTVTEALARDGIGGFILFGGNVEETPQRLRELQSLAAVPLLIASDVERGLGQQLSGGTRFPSQRAVASAVNRRSAKDAGLLSKMLDAVRIETRAAGIHVVFSPVVDVNNNPDNPIICTRAFGDTPDVVEWFGTRYISRLQKTRGARRRLELLACAKHFPGHGDTDQDSHSVLPVIRAGRARLNRVELPPFRQAVKDGVAMVMVAHLMVPALDPENPTTFSKKIVTALLREGMSFEGLIVSDALDMGALAGICSEEEIAVRAVEAGMDILLHPKDARVTIDAVVDAVERGALTRQRISESVHRIMAAKTKLGLFEGPGPKPGRIDYGKHRWIARELGRKAPRITAGDKGLVPLKSEGGIACFILDDDNNMESGDVLIQEMKRRFPHLSVMVLTPASTPPESLVRDCIIAAENVVLTFFSRISASKGRSGISGTLRDTATGILHHARAAQGNSIVISFDSPYILDSFKDADVRIEAYDRMDEIQTAVAELLAGE
ncbi:MAG TPA: glycoside hydrolase family 3 N-terminal domain-containing protein [Nitrospirota bacterium]